MLIIWGERAGRRAKARMDLSAFHDYRYEQVANAGHWVHHDQFDVFMKLVDGFLAE